MSRKYHLQLQGSHWCLVDEGEQRTIKSFWTKKEGTTHSLSYVERHGGSLVIHRLDGSFQEEHAYPGFEQAFPATQAGAPGAQISN